MHVYRAYYHCHDAYIHIGLFYTMEGAWIGCYDYYKKHMYYKVCFKEGHTFDCGCKVHRLRSSRFTRYEIVREEVIVGLDKTDFCKHSFVITGELYEGYNRTVHKCWKCNYIYKYEIQ